MDSLVDSEEDRNKVNRQKDSYRCKESIEIVFKKRGEELLV